MIGVWCSYGAAPVVRVCVLFHASVFVSLDNVCGETRNAQLQINICTPMPMPMPMAAGVRKSAHEHPSAGLQQRPFTVANLNQQALGKPQ